MNDSPTRSGTGPALDPTHEWSRAWQTSKPARPQLSQDPTPTPAQFLAPPSTPGPSTSPISSGPTGPGQAQPNPGTYGDNPPPARRSRAPIVIAAVVALIAAIGAALAIGGAFSSDTSAVGGQTPATTEAPTTAPTAATLPTLLPTPVEPQASVPATPTPTSPPSAPADTAVTTLPANTSGLTDKQQRAADAASERLASYPLSREATIRYLVRESEGERFGLGDARIGVDSLDVDWNEHAVIQAQRYLDNIGVSKRGLVALLTSKGAGFTVDEANYATEHVDVDWSAQPRRWAQRMLESEPFSRASLLSYMTYVDGGGFEEQESIDAIDGLDVDWNAEAAEAADQELERYGPKSCDDMLYTLTEFEDFTPEQARAGAVAVGVC